MKDGVDGLGLAFNFKAVAFPLALALWLSCKDRPNRPQPKGLPTITDVPSD